MWVSAPKTAPVISPVVSCEQSDVRLAMSFLIWGREWNILVEVSSKLPAQA